MAVPAEMNLAAPYVELSYVDAVRERQRRPLLDCVTNRFQDVAPVRPFRWSQGERHFAGWYWAACRRMPRKGRSRGLGSIRNSTRWPSVSEPRPPS